MANTTNYSWETPDDTDLVKDGAAAIRTLGSSIDTTTKALNPSTTLGDIEYRSSTANTNTRLGIGSTGNVLTVAGGVPTWAAPAGGGSNFTLLNTGGTTLSGSTTTVSGISGKDKIVVLLKNASSTNAVAQIRFLINGDTTSKYYNFGAVNYSAAAYSAENFENITSGSATPATEVRLGRMSSQIASQMDGVLFITGANSAGSKMYQFTGGANAPSGSSTQENRWGGGYYDSSSTISSISVDCSTGTFDTGTVYVFTSAS